MTHEAGVMTAEELLDYSNEPYRQELIAGKLYEMEPTGMLHGAVAGVFLRLLAPHVHSSGLGMVFATEAGYLLASDPDTVRAPDASFIARERIEAEGVPDGFWRGAPDLAVEVLSPRSRRVAVHAKALDWLAAGTRVVVVLETRKRIATVYRPGDDARVLESDATLDLDDVVAGFAPRVDDLFV